MDGSCRCVGLACVQWLEHARDAKALPGAKYSRGKGESLRRPGRGRAGGTGISGSCRSVGLRCVQRLKHARDVKALRKPSCSRGKGRT